MKFNKGSYATVAQLVEQLIRNQQVAGSSPASSSKIAFRNKTERVFFNSNPADYPQGFDCKKTEPKGGDSAFS